MLAAALGDSSGDAGRLDVTTPDKSQAAGPKSITLPDGRRAKVVSADQFMATVKGTL